MLDLSHSSHGGGRRQKGGHLIVAWRGGGPRKKGKWSLACFHTWGSTFVSALLMLSGSMWFFVIHAGKVSEAEAFKWI